MWRSAVQVCQGLQKREGGLAQLARAPALQAGGRRFESVILHPVPVRQVGQAGNELQIHFPLPTSHFSLESTSLFDILEQKEKGSQKWGPERNRVDQCEDAGSIRILPEVISARPYGRERRRKKERAHGGCLGSGRR